MPAASVLRQPDPHALLRRRYREARDAGASRHRDIAAQLDCSEGELIAAHAGEHAAALQATRLQPHWPALLQGLGACGEVMALTRNASCVHERLGRYEDVSGEGSVGLVLGPDIDLRCFYAHWRHGFAVTEVNAKGVQQSLLFFDAQGEAVHKVFLRETSDHDAWAALQASHRASDQTPGLAIQLLAGEPAEKPDAEVDLAAFHEEWAGLHDTHHFHGLLQRHGLTRTQALRLAEPRFAQDCDLSSARELLHGAAQQALPIMVFVGSRGVIQIHTGPVSRVQPLGPWLNVLDARFNLHLREDHIAQSWVVRKPTTDGLVTSLELYDAAGRQIAQFFGARKPGKPELGAWRRLVEGLLDHPQAEGACGSC